MQKTRKAGQLQTVHGTKKYEWSTTIGEVVDTNDPQQNGRLRVYCPALGDAEETPIGLIPWALYASPFAGATDIGTRGRGGDEFKGPVSYGLWALPKVGARVLVTCIDGDPSQRVWFAAIYPNFLSHTMPHGRYLYSQANKPEGPLSSAEQPINPLYNNQNAAFNNPTVGVEARQSFEYRTRGADYQASYVDDQYLALPDDPIITEVADDRGVRYQQPNGQTITSNQGYGQSRIEPDVEYPNTDGVNWDSQTYSWTTPGFHAISMDDRAENCRIRIRTTGGHQIIMDDTNERVYISTSNGQTWIELDEKGTIDVYSTQTMSFRAEGDINFTTNQTFRVTAAQGIHLASELDVRVEAKGGDLSAKTSSNLRLEAGADAFVQAGGQLNLLAGAAANVQGGADVNLKAGGNVIQQGTQIHLNGPPAADASPAEAAAAYYASRTPQHEPWARVYNSKAAADGDSNNSIVPEYGYNSPEVGKGSAERGINFNRNPLWKR